jgi:hypothetical protein
MSGHNRRVSTLRESLYASKDGRRFSVHPSDEGEKESASHRALREHPGHQRLHACLDTGRASTVSLRAQLPSSKKIYILMQGTRA